MTHPTKTMRTAPAIIGVLAIIAAIGADAPKPLDRFTLDADGLRKAYERADRVGSESRGLVFKSRIEPHWSADGARFWYRNDLKDRAREFILVDASAGTRSPAFDHDRLAKALAEVSGKEVRGDRLPFDAVEYLNDNKSIAFRSGDVGWTCDLASYAMEKDDRKPNPKPPEGLGTAIRAGIGRMSRRTGPRSPDGRWVAETKDFNVAIRPIAGGDPITLSDDGKAGHAYGEFAWSPDSKTLVAYRIDPAEPGITHRIESSPSGGGRAKLHNRP